MLQRTKEKGSCRRKAAPYFVSMIDELIKTESAS